MLEETPHVSIIQMQIDGARGLDKEATIIILKNNVIKVEEITRGEIA